MNTNLPDKHIRKEIYDRIHNMEVDGVTFKCYNQRTVAKNDKQYFLVTTQLNQPNRSKCGRGWFNSTEIQVVVRKPKNFGSVLLLDNAVDSVLTELESFSLPISSGMKISEDDVSVDNQIEEITGGEIIYTKILRLVSKVN